MSTSSNEDKNVHLKTRDESKCYIVFSLRSVALSCDSCNTLSSVTGRWPRRGSTILLTDQPRGAEGWPLENWSPEGRSPSLWAEQSGYMTVNHTNHYLQSLFMYDGLPTKGGDSDGLTGLTQEGVAT